ncbi:MAG: ribosome-associated translation inhibitor RaiA, partial [Chlamydiota bacterium]
MSNKSKAAAFAGEGYEIHVTGRNVLVTEAMKTYAVEKVGKIERFSDRIIDVVVTMDIQKVDHCVDLKMKVGNFHVKSHARTEDMYASIDQAVKKIERQLVRYKGRMQDHHARPLESVDMEVNVLRAPSDMELDEINDAIEDETIQTREREFGIHEVVTQTSLPL